MFNQRGTAPLTPPPPSPLHHTLTSTNFLLKSPDLLSHSRPPLFLFLSIALAAIEQVHTTPCGSSFNEKCSSAASRFFEVTLELVATFSSVRTAPMHCFIWYVFGFVTGGRAFFWVPFELSRRIVVRCAM